MIKVTMHTLQQPIFDLETDPWIRIFFADPDPGNQNVADPKHWLPRSRLLGSFQLNI